MPLTADQLNSYRKDRAAAAARRAGLTPPDYAASHSIIWNDEKLLQQIMDASGVPEYLREEIRNYYPKYVHSEDLGAHDMPDSHRIMANLIEKAQSIAASIELPVGSNFVFGATLDQALTAHQLPVLGERESIIELSMGLILFMNTLAKLVAAMFSYFENNEVSFDGSLAIEKLKGRPELLYDWFMLIASYAARDEIPDWRPWPMSAKPEFAVRAQILEAVEVFAVSHELGHHALEHGANDQVSGAASYSVELDADVYAGFILIKLGFDGDQKNIFAASRAGGVLLLCALDLVERARSVLNYGHDHVPPSGTHPPLQERLQNLAKLDDTCPVENREMFGNVRAEIRQIVGDVWKELKPAFLELHQEGIRATPRPNSDWLPV